MREIRCLCAIKTNKLSPCSSFSWFVSSRKANSEHEHDDDDDDDLAACLVGLVKESQQSEWDQVMEKPKWNANQQLRRAADSCALTSGQPFRRPTTTRRLAGTKVPRKLNLLNDGSGNFFPSTNSLAFFARQLAHNSPSSQFNDDQLALAWHTNTTELNTQTDGQFVRRSKPFQLDTEFFRQIIDETTTTTTTLVVSCL